MKLYYTFRITKGVVQTPSPINSNEFSKANISFSGNLNKARLTANKAKMKYLAVFIGLLYIFIIEVALSDAGCICGQPGCNCGCHGGGGRFGAHGGYPYPGASYDDLMHL